MGATAGKQEAYLLQETVLPGEEKPRNLTTRGGGRLKERRRAPPKRRRGGYSSTPRVRGQEVVRFRLWVQLFLR